MPPLASRVDQVALIVPDLEGTMDAYVASLGVAFQVFDVDETNSSFSGSSPQYRIRIAVALAGLSSIELIQPVSGVTFYSRHLESGGSGIHHLAFYVDDLDYAKKALTARGCGLLLEGRIDQLGSFAYFDAPDMYCVLEPLQLSVELPLFLAEKARWYEGLR